MNKSTLKYLLLVAVPLTLCAVVLGTSSGLSILSLPFTLAGDGLRHLSLSGTGGNIAAIILYALLSLSPLAFKLRRKWSREDWLLPLCSALLLYVLYYMVNPTLRPSVLQNSVGDLILSGVVYSALLSWAVIKLILHCDSMNSAKLLSTLRHFLTVCAALFLCALAVGFGNCQAEIHAIAAANTAPGLNLTTTNVFVYLAYAATVLEYLLTVYLLLLAAKLVRELEADPYSTSCTLAAQKMALWCRRSLIAVTLSALALQVAQLIFAAKLHNIAVNFRLPIIGIVISFALLALSRLLCETREIKNDNDLFI